MDRWIHPPCPGPQRRSVHGHGYCCDCDHRVARRRRWMAGFTSVLGIHRDFKKVRPRLSLHHAKVPNECSAWGMRGAFWPVLNRVVIGCVWMGGCWANFPLIPWQGSTRELTGCLGIQMYWGGQAVRIILSSIIGPKFYYMSNTIPSSANVQTPDLISFFIFVLILGKVSSFYGLGSLLICFVAPMLWIRPEKLQLPFRVCPNILASALS